MAEISLSIAEVFEQAFGYRPSTFEQKLEDHLDTKYNYLKTAQNPYGTNRTTAKGQAFTGQDNLGRDYYMPVNLDGYDLHHPVVSISGKKRIIETPLTERTGVVKELISVDDWEMTIRGIIVGKYGDYPEDAVTKLVDLFHRNKAIEIKCAITDIFLMRWERQGNNMAVIKEMNFPEVRGIMNVRPYELKLVSDAPFSLEEIK